MNGIKSLVIGLAIAAILCLAGWGSNWNAERNLSSLIAICEQSQKGIESNQSDAVPRQGFISLYPCDPSTMPLSSNGLTKQQIAVQTAYSQTHDSGAVWWIAAFLVALVGCLPVAWYFLLARVRELGKAFKGQD